MELVESYLHMHLPGEAPHVIHGVSFYGKDRLRIVHGSELRQTIGRFDFMIDDMFMLLLNDLGLYDQVSVANIFEIEKL